MRTLTKENTPMMAGLAVILMLIVSPAHAIFPKLTTNLTGPSIAGVTPSGRASADQSKYPAVNPYLSVFVSKVNVPDGTVLAVNMSTCPYFGPVAYLTIVNKTASIGVYLPQTCMVGRLSALTITRGTTVLLSGGYPWKI